MIKSVPLSYKNFLIAHICVFFNRNQHAEDFVTKVLTLAFQVQTRLRMFLWQTYNHVMWDRWKYMEEMYLIGYWPSTGKNFIYHLTDVWPLDILRNKYTVLLKMFYNYIFLCFFLIRNNSLRIMLQTFSLLPFRFRHVSGDTSIFLCQRCIWDR